MHWKNSSFQVVAFIVGKCHTADEARRKLLLLQDERVQALDHAKATAMRAEANAIRARKALEIGDEADKLDAQATLFEIERNSKRQTAMVEEAKREVAFIETVLNKIDPHRKYKSLPDEEAVQVIQREEWCLELIQRAQNYLYCNGTIPHDHFATMRSHPDFHQVIRPIVGAMHEALLAKDINKLASYTITPSFLKELAEVELLGPAPDIKAIFRSIRLELPAKT